MIEYKVREVKRYIVTRWEGEKPQIFRDLNGNVVGAQGGGYGPAKSSQHGEFDNAEMAYAVGYALCKTEQDKLGYPPGDDRIQYPELPAGATGEGVRY